ncbi:hypothetical protein V8B97DRAFT_1970895 [Scleroderma yunnanense]
MPLLGGIFKRDKQSSSRNPPSSYAPATPQSAASVSSARESIEADYVFPDKSLPRPAVYSGPAGASSSKIKLPFRRNRLVHPPDTSDASQPAAVSLNDVPPPSCVVSDSGHGLPPPPPKSSIFGLYYSDRNSNSTSIHSFSTDSHSPFSTDTLSRSSLTDVRSEATSSVCTSPSKHPPKKSSLFSWARQRTKSKASEPPSTISSPQSAGSGFENSSFNLKAFRHVPPGNASTERKETSTTADYALPPPRPRPRGDSTNSDSSQRISVAAFREAQARKSRANSPVPSFRPPSAADTLRLDGRQRASTVSAVSGMDNPQSIRNSITQLSTRPNSSALQSSSDSSESESEDDEDVDSDDEPTQKLNREHTITHRGSAVRTQSEIGHSSLREESPNSEFARQPRTSQHNAPYTPRTMASASTSALAPEAAAPRASISTANSASASPVPVPKQVPQKKQPQKNDDSNTSSDSTESDSDLPLSTLIPPKRPGSSASTSTNKSPRVPPKPLIDIKTLVGSPPVLTPVLRHENSIKTFKGKERDANKDEPFSPPPILRLSSNFVLPDSPSASSVKGHSPLASTKEQPATTHHRRMSSEMTATPSAKSPSDSIDDLMNAIRLVNSLDMEREKEREKTKSPTTSSPLPSVRASEPEPTSTTSDRIIPTPIRERQPLSSFAVVSRPPQRASTAEILQTVSSSIVPPSAVPSQVPASSPPPPVATTRPTTGTGSRSRSATLANLTSSPDKSDTKSNASSAPRSSRIPSVPLIHSIPDSPSVKTDYKPSSQSTAMKQRATSVGPWDTRSRPHSGTLVSLSPVASSPPSSSARNSSFVPYPSQSLMPQRPFVSNSSVRGESPAPSSTGDSSNGGPPFTPRDGSEIGIRLREGGSDVGSTLKVRSHGRRPSVTFEDIPEKGRERVRERAKSEAAEEERRRDRRRSEAKAAIEFGKLVNSRGPLIRDDSDDDLAPRSGNKRASVKPLIGMEGSMSGMLTPHGWTPWQQPMGTGMSGMVPTPQFNDPAFVAAHQRAMMVAKQAYQMAVAQHAIAVAGEEWERSSSIGFGSGGSAYGGSAASVYGGGGGGMVVRPTPGMGMGMMGMQNMGMLVPPGPWHGGPVMFPNAASIYGGGISSTQSEFGGGSGWASKSAYGDSFGPSTRSSYLHAGHGAHGSSASAYGGPAPKPGPTPRQRAQTGAAPPSSTSSKSPGRNRVPPPSSWKNAR